MPIPGFSTIPPPERVSAGEAVAMVMERFRSSRCTDADACAWLFEQVRRGTLKLLWVDSNPDYLTGLQLSGESVVYIPGFPGAQALDQLDWRVGELRRRVKYPKIADRWGGCDSAKMTYAQLLARDEELRARHEYNALSSLHLSQSAGDTRDETEEFIVEKLTYRFEVGHSALVAILDRASVPLGTLRVPLLEAAEIIGRRFDLSPQMGLQVITEAGAAERIDVYGKPVAAKTQYGWPEDRISPWVWRKIERGEIALSHAAPVGDPTSGTWSDPYVYRGNLERLMRELDGDDAGAEIGRGQVGLETDRNRMRIGRRAAAFWEEAETEGMRWLQDNGFPAQNDGNQAKLERHILDWLAERNHEPSESTVRRHVQRCIARYREEIGAEGQNAMK